MDALIAKTNIYLIPPVLLLVTGFSLALFSLLKGKRQKDNITFGLVCIWWSIVAIPFIAHHIFRGDTALILTIERSVHVMYAFLPAVGLVFFNAIAGYQNRRIEIAGFTLSAALSCTTFTDHYIYGLWEYPWGYIAKSGVLFNIFSAFGLFTTLYGIVLFIVKMRTTTDVTQRLKLKYIMLSMIGICVLTLGNVPSLNGIDFYPTGNFAFLPMLLMAWGIYRHDVIRINRYVRQRIAGTLVRVFVVIALVLIVPFALWAYSSMHVHDILPAMVPYGIPPLLSFIACALLTVLGLMMGENRRETLIFSIICVAYTYLSLDIFINCTVDDPFLGLRASRTSHLIMVFAPALGMHLTRAVTGRSRDRLLNAALYVAGAVLCVFSQTDWYLGGIHRYQWGQFARTAPLFHVMTALSGVTTLYTIVILTGAYRRERHPYYRRSLLYLFLGSVIGALISLGNFPAMNGYDIYPAGNFIFIPMSFLAIALYRYNLAEMRRLATGVVRWGVMAGLVIALAAALWQARDTDHLAPLIALSMGALIAVNRSWESLTARFFGGHARNLKNAYETIGAALSKSRNFGDVDDRVAETVFPILLSRYCLLLFLDTGTGAYLGSQRWNANRGIFTADGPGRDDAMGLDGESPLLELFRDRRTPFAQIDVEEWLLYHERTVAPDDPVRTATVTVPVYSEDRLVAMVLLGAKIDGSVYSREELDFLYHLGLGLGPYIENARILQQLETTIGERTVELGESEKKYRAVLENIKEGYVEIDLAGNVIFFNHAFCEITGYGASELAGMNYSRFAAPGTAQFLYESFNALFRSPGRSGSIEFEIIRKDGVTRIIDSAIYLITGEGGHITGFYGFGRDITERKRAEEALRISEEKYRSILSNIREAYYELDLAGTMTFANKALCDISGYPVERAIGMSFRTFMSEETAAEAIRFFDDLGRHGTESDIFAFDLVRSDGEIRSLESSITLSRDDAGTVTAYTGLARDVTERKRAEEDLRRSAENYRALVENASDVVYRVNDRGMFTFINAAGLKASGYNLEEIIEMHYTDVIRQDHREAILETGIRQLQENIGKVYYEFPVVRKDGSEFWVGQNVMLVRDLAGSAEFHAIARDITDKKQADDARRELEEQKTRFFANISHEIRTPLTLMISPIESVLQGDYGTSVGQDFFRNLHRNGLRLLNLINNLLDFSKIEAGRMTIKVREFDIISHLNAFIEAIEPAIAAKGLRLAFNPLVGSLHLFYDQDKIDKVFMNLFSNAMKFTEDGGAITITVDRAGDCCRIQFEDTGVGIHAPSLPAIFERFAQADNSSTRRYEGTGIGLALVKEFIDLHGGTVVVESRSIGDHPDNHGTVFTIEIPIGKEHFADRDDVRFRSGTELDEAVADLATPMHEADTGIGLIETGISAPQAVPAAPPPDAPTILVIDDNPDMREFMRFLLRGRYRVLEAENGLLGLDTANRLRPDIIITDVMMPQMDGYELTRRLKDDPEMKHIPVIMITAKADIAQKIEGLEQGADDYLTKPFNSKELMARIRSLLRSAEYEKVITARNREIEDALDLARMLQRKTLPQGKPNAPGFNAHFVFIPMDKVGGDFYDFRQTDSALELIIADVSGHGLTGAFLASITKTALAAIPTGTDVCEVQSRLNETMYHSTVKGNFVTSFFCSIDTRSGVMRFCSAGHPSQFIHRRKTGEIIAIKTRGTPLGWFKDIRLNAGEIPLVSGDVLLLYTDGITECMSPDREQFGEERLQECMLSGSGLPPERFAEAVLTRLKEFSGSEEFDDDLTMIVLEVR